MLLGQGTEAEVFPWTCLHCMAAQVPVSISQLQGVGQGWQRGMWSLGWVEGGKEDLSAASTVLMHTGSPASAVPVQTCCSLQERNLSCTAKQKTKQNNKKTHPTCLTSIAELGGKRNTGGERLGGHPSAHSWGHMAPFWVTSCACSVVPSQWARQHQPHITPDPSTASATSRNSCRFCAMNLMPEKG